MSSFEKPTKQRRLDSTTHLASKVRCSDNVMQIIAQMMPLRRVLTPQFRDVLGVKAAIQSRIHTPEAIELLFTAIRDGQTGIVKALLDAGADKDGKNSYGDTPLHIAV